MQCCDCFWCGLIFYYVVIFSFYCSVVDDGYVEVVECMLELVSCQLGYFGVELVCGVDGFGIIVFYWDSEVVICVWSCYVEYCDVQVCGWCDWYVGFSMWIVWVECEYVFLVQLDIVQFLVLF